MLHLIESECVMKKFAKLYASLAAIVAASFLYSCVERVETVQEGIPTSLTIRISTPAPAEISTRATDLQETKVSEIALFFYRDGNYLDKPKKVIRLSQSNLVLSNNNLSSTNYIYTANIPEDAGLTSGNYFLYAVANYNSSTFGDVELSKLEKLSLAQLQNFLITKSNEDIQMIEESLLMSGVYGSDGRITLKESGNNNFKDNIHLRRITAKIIFNLTAESGISFQPKTYSVYNCAKKCTLFERSGWTGAKGSFPGSLGSVATADSDFSDKLNVDMSGETGMSFYLLENVQNAKKTAASQKDREKHVSASDQSFLNAPENGTYVVIKGIYNGPISALASDEISSEVSSTQVSGEVSYTIHLGDFSNAEDGYDNYSIRRNTKYIYNVKVTGVKSIYTEASVSSDQGGDNYGSYDSGAEGTLINLSAGTTNITVDSHFETIMVKMPSGTSAEEYSLKLDTPKGEFIYTQNSDNSAADVSWIKFIKPDSSKSLPPYNPDPEKSTDIFGLLADMKKNGANGGKFYIVDGEYYYTAAFLDEYYYNDLKLAQFVNAPEREMTLATTIAVSPDGKSSYAVTPIFSIRQQSIKSMYNLALEDSDTYTSFNPFGIEILEEFSAVTWNGTKYVDDSYIDSSSETNGRSNFSAILSDRRWSTYVNSEHFGHFDNSTLLHSDAMKINYARSQCLSRNRDEDGDGTIDDDEIKWYLPALQQTLTIWYGYPSLGNDAKLFIDYQGYFTSTLKKQQRVWYIDEGVSFGMYSGAEKWLFGYGGSSSNATGLLGVRCARTLKDSSVGPTATTEINPKTKVISLKTLGKESVRTSTVTGEYSSHIRNEEPDKLPVAFQVARNFVSDATGNQLFTLTQVQEGSLCHDYYAQDGENVGEGGWRVPNEREFGLMVKHSAEGGYSMDDCMARTQYIRRFDANPITSGYFYSTNLNTDGLQVPNTHKVRCVRDYATTSSAYVD